MAFVYRLDPSAAQHALAIVKHDRLPWRNRALRIAKFDFCPPLTQHRYPRRRGVVAIAYFRLAYQRPRRGFLDEPVHA